MGKVELELITDPDIAYSLKKVWEVEFFIFLIDIVKPTISIWNLMTQNKDQNIVIQFLNFFQQVGFNRIDPKEFDLNKYISNSSNRCGLEVDLEYPKELWELQNERLAPDKIEIKREMSNYQLNIADLYNIPIGNIKK